MANDDDYYKGDSPFDGYVVTSVNPGLKLLAITSCYVAFVMLLGMLLRFRRSRKNKKEYDTNDLSVSKLNASKKKLKLFQRKNGEEDSINNSQAGMETLDLVHSDVDMAQLSKDSSFNHIEEIRVMRRRKRGMLTRQRRGLLKKNSILYRGKSAKLAAKTKESEDGETSEKMGGGFYVLEFANHSGKNIKEEQINKEGKKNSNTRGTVSGHSRLNKVGDYEGDDYTQMTDEEVGDLNLQPNKDFSTELMNMLNLARP